MFNEASIGLRPRMFNFELEDNFSSETPAFLSQTRFFYYKSRDLLWTERSYKEGSLFKCLALEH